MTRTAALALASLLVFACGASGGAKPPTATSFSPALQKIITAAKTEGQLTLRFSAGTQDSADEQRKLVDGFNKTYGLDLKVAHTVGPTMAEIAEQVFQEQQAGRPASTDVYLGDETQIIALNRVNALESVLWTTWSPNIRDPKLVTPGGTSVQVQTRMPGITYNTRLTGDAIPRTLADLLRPSLRGRVLTSPEAVNLAHLGSPQVWGVPKTTDYVRQFSGQLGGLAPCGEESRVSSADFDVFAYDCGGHRAAQLAKRGQPIGWTVPTDGAFVGYLYMGVPKNATHPNAARLWISYMLGRQAQDVMFEYEFADLHLLAGSKTFAEVDRYTKQGVRFFELTVEFVQSDENRGVRGLRPVLEEILQRVVSRRG